MDDAKKWQVKEGALLLLADLAQSAPSQVSMCLPAIVPLISERLVDPREQVRPRGAPGGSSTNSSSSSSGLGLRLVAFAVITATPVVMLVEMCYWLC
jgi:hypothetical protein